MVGLWLLQNVADGIAEAIKEESKTGTQTVLQRIGTAIGRRVRRDVPKAMASPSGDAELDEAASTAESAWTETDSILAQKSDLTADEIAWTASDSVSAALIEAGLPAASAERVRAALRAEILRLLDER
ncbi:hypothetical protein AB0B25_20895 [Nocardia sp. NPDC049190]|uniref:hypothetical protein n=1 Tax=Nocardia sp. NPDC049190 TaxID=3155650 RepID=UPI0033E8ECB8